MTNKGKDADAALIACRVCLNCVYGAEEMLPIQEHDPSDEFDYLYEKIEKCGDIKISLDPELPNHICYQCHTILELAYRFRVICRKTERYLMEYQSRKGDNQSDLIDIIKEETKELNKMDNPLEDTILMGPEDIVQSEGNQAQEEAVEFEDPDCMDEQEPLYSFDDLIEEDPGTEIYDDDDLENFYEELVEQSHVEDKEDSEKSPTAIMNFSNEDEDEDEDEDEPAITPPRVQIKKGPKSKEKTKHICDVCGNVYLRKYSLEAHMRRHRDERPFECEICNKTFYINFQLTRHMRRHTGDRPYTCRYCHRTFTDSSTTAKHERIHRNERPFVCETCGKSFTYSNVLKAHRFIHTGEKPYVCGICGKRFTRSHHLRAHLETLIHAKDPRAKLLVKQINSQAQTENQLPPDVEQ